MISDVIQTSFVVFLLAGVPALSFLTTRKIQARLLPRAALYFSAVVSQWLLAALCLLVMLVTSQSFSNTGFRTVSTTTLISWASLMIVISLGAMGLTLLLEKRGWWPEESELVRLLVPETSEEKMWAVAVLAPTAAFCEEYLYRGYLLTELSHWFHSAHWGWAISSMAFGLAHIYQGASGVVRASLLGALLAYPVVRLGSLYPSMGAHLVIDGLALAWLGPTFLRRN